MLKITFSTFFRSHALQISWLNARGIVWLSQVQWILVSFTSENSQFVCIFELTDKQAVLTHFLIINVITSQLFYFRRLIFLVTVWWSSLFLDIFQKNLLQSFTFHLRYNFGSLVHEESEFSVLNSQFFCYLKTQ